MWTPGRMKISIYHAHEFNKTIKSMAMIYILPAPAKTLGMPARPSGKFSKIIIKKLSIRIK
jgi:hypothetical protein